MSIEQIRKACANDQPQLHRLWEIVFGDPPELVQAFYDLFPPEISGWVLCYGETICSAAYVIPGNWYICQSDMRPAGYVYAVATDPGMRGRGYAGALMRAISEFARDRNLLLYTRPAEQSLFPWYEAKMKAGNVGYFQHRHFTVVNGSEKLSLRRLSPAEYGAAREHHLANQPHLILAENFLRLQEIYSDGFYAVGKGCCCVIKEKEKIQIPELLIPNVHKTEAIQTLLEHFQTSEASARFVGTSSDIPGVAFAGNALPEQTNWGLFLE